MGATVSRRLVGLFLLPALCWGAPRAAPATPDSAPALTITFAEGAAQLARATSLYRAGRGAVLHKNDLLASGSGAIQLDNGAITVAIGPASRVWIRNTDELILLDGWLKVQARAGQAVTVATTHLALAGAGSTLALRATPAASALFAESGAVLVHELDAGKRKRGISVPHEHFAMRAGAAPLRLADRPPAAFLAAMPRGFRDELVPLAVGGPPVMPRPERAATFAELAPWVSAHPALVRQLRARFDPPRPARPTPRVLPLLEHKASP